MKIVFLTATSAFGGTEVHTAHLAGLLVRRGHAVTILSIGHRFYELPKLKGLLDGVDIIPIDIKKKFQEFNLLDSFKLTGKAKFDVCVLAKGNFTTGTAQLDLAMRLRCRRYLTIEHSTCEPMPEKVSRRYLRGLVPGIGVWWYRRLLTARSRSLFPNRIVSVSECSANKLVENYGIDRKKIVVVHNGVDAKIFYKRSEPRSTLRKDWGVPDDAFLFGAVGRLSFEKGSDRIPKIFREVASGDVKTRLVLVGEGPLGPGLKHEASDLIEKGLVGFAGHVDRPWEVYSAFDAFLLPSRIEGLPLSLLEAMACECPPIAMGVGGVPEVIASPDVGFLIEAGDLGSFRDAMHRMACLGEKKRDDIGRSARNRVLEQFNMQSKMIDICNIIEYN